jgi:hypothetical protein
MTVQHPINTPKQLAVDTMKLCEYLRTCDKAELALLLVPEMYELIVNWDGLQYVRRGELMGYCLGKYGVDILLPLATVKGIKYLKAYRDIKNAEKFAVLQTLAESPQGKEALIQAGTKWKQLRKDYFAKIELNVADQGKHIREAHNFIPTRSEWTHSNPAAKIKQLAGKGQKVAGKPGKPGFRERVDCGEVIGYFCEESTGNKIPTTMAIIHYGKKGAHIVPVKPKK